MFFYLSKILAFALSPLLWILTVLVLTIILKNAKTKRALSGSALLLVLIFSNQWLFRLAAGVLEVPTIPSTTITKNIEIAVIAGGTASWHESAQRVRFNQSADRLWQGIDLLKQGKVKRLVFTGGTADLKQEKKREASYISAYIHQLGIADSLFITEEQSKNTYENALFTKALFEQKGYNKRIILVTSAFHMKRAMGCFEKQGFEVIPYACDPLTNGEPLKIHEYFLPSPQAMMGWEVIIKEWTGYFVYKMKGFV